MDNEIILKQNRAENLDCLAAMRYLYSNAKFYMKWQVFFNVIFIAVFSIVAYLTNSDLLWFKYDMSAHLAFFSIVVTLTNTLIFVPVIKSKKELAAKIQEKFDTNVLSFDWNDVNVGNPPDNEVIKLFSERFKEKRNYSELKDWYAKSVANVPFYVARFLCQRSNLVWNVGLRNEYIKYIFKFSVIFGLVIAVFGFLSDITFSNFVLNVATPLLPILTFCIEQYRENKDSIENLEKLKQDMDSYWQELIENKDSIENNVFARRIQDEIYKNRKDNQLFFDEIYDKLKNKYEDAMYYNVNQMIEKYNRS
ncbi:S-4TM family putative pore-forming effector [Methylomonas rapida]|uniref:S-4TM family putative pore-forming effector n=1 Tax=Methylomonas rapida TaxID=2963939 RepID=A0ABY7GP87_9GAMM|nr:S-4TM family putative pore-forming effector [Methylomonas rapida]WAR46327.1 S-4TM family putative pore-forming effector [Methylomonas rapida]